MPPDIAGRIESDFGPAAAEAAEILATFLAHGDEAVSDRLVRCIVYLARGNLETLCETIDLAEKDYRDVIWAAEYDGTQVRRQDFSQPFE